ncbi:MAG: glycosyltransferase family 4 protein [Candidatus Binataceae bacterium]
MGRSMRQQNRIAIICGSLAQAGTERYVYELCRALDKTRFAVDLLTIAPWGVGRQYYAEPIRQCGIAIRPILPLFHWRRLPKLLRRYALAGQEVYRSWLLPKLLAHYDLVIVVQLDYLSDVAFMLPPDTTVLLHLTTHLCQHEPNYYRNKYPGDRAVFLVCMDRCQAQQAQEGLGSVIRGQTVVPLPIDVSGFEEITEWSSSTHPIIGSFMRIEPDRDHMPLLRAFAILAKESDAELRCYGRGDASFLEAEAIRLGVGGRVKFPGHVTDIRRTVIDDHIALAWLTAHDDFMGYAGIELGLWGVPTYFYNVIGTMSVQAILRQTAGTVHSYSSEAELAQASLALLRNPGLLREEGRRLRQYVQWHNDSKHVVRQIESFYEEVLQGTRCNPRTNLSASQVAGVAGDLSVFATGGSDGRARGQTLPGRRTDEGCGHSRAPG